MDNKQIAKQMIQFNKAVFDNSIRAMTMVVEQNEKMVTRPKSGFRISGAFSCWATDGAGDVMPPLELAGRATRGRP